MAFALQILPTILKGLEVTVEATIFGSILGFLLGLALTLLRMARIPLLSQLVWAFIEFARSGPLLVQLYFVYFAVFPAIGLSHVSALVAGVITLGVHYAGYTSDSYRAGILGVPKGQWEAATALSLPRLRLWQSIVLPQAIRRSLPALGNYLISMYKDTPLLIAIGVPEMLTAAQTVGSLNYTYEVPYLMVGSLFLILSYPSSILVRRLERLVGRQ